MKSTEIIIRQMIAEDLEQVHALDQRSFPTPWPLKSFKYELEQNKAAHMWVAEEEGKNLEKKIIGTIVVWLLIDEAHIATLAVDESYRRRGIASQLIFTALSHLVEKGAIVATLEVRESNTPAQALYQGFGFQPVGRRRAYYRDSGEDAIIMALQDIDVSQLSSLVRGRVKNMAQVEGGTLGTACGITKDSG
jgi:ribosomal-protein-alanine N-acetyltransferase